MFKGGIGPGLALSNTTIPKVNAMELAMRGKLPKINFGDLKKICRMRIKDFHSYGERFRTEDGPFFFKDNGADILAVAHLDTVQGFQHFATVPLKQDTIIYCTTLDDRLGVYTILKYLPSLGLKYDILLTTGEESGNSTAAYFEPPRGKKYKWVFSFDLPESGAKMYQYESKEGKSALAAVGVKLEPNFAYSDICSLEHLQAQCFNFGAGYYNHHTMYAAASKKIWLSQVRAFIQFYRNNKNIGYSYLPKYNVFSLIDGFEYDPKNKSDFFDEQELQFLQELTYEASSKGLNPEVFDTKLTKSAVRHAIERKKKGDVPFNVRPSEDVAILKPSAIKESPERKDPKFSMGVGVIQYPSIKPGNPTVKEIQDRIKQAGRETKVLSVCVRCQKEFEQKAGLVTDYCDSCKIVVMESEKSGARRAAPIIYKMDNKPTVPVNIHLSKRGRIETKIPLENKENLKFEYVLSTQNGEKKYIWRPILKVGFETVPKAQIQGQV